MEEKLKLDNILKRFLNTFKNFKSLYRNDRRSFYLVTTKVLFGYLFFTNLFKAFYKINFLGIAISFDVTQTKVFFKILIVVVMSLIVIVHAFFAYERNNKIADIIFKVQMVLSALVFLLFLIIFFGDGSVKSLGFGFYVDIVLIAGMSILAWAEGLFVKLYDKLFKKELEAIGQAVEPVTKTKTEPEELKEVETVEETKAAEVESEGKPEEKVEPETASTEETEVKE